MLLGIDREGRTAWNVTAESDSVQALKRYGNCLKYE